MKLIAGLGNPGRDYQQTRHNVGFMVLDRLTKRFPLTGPRQKFHGDVMEGIIAGQKCMLLAPTTFMNRSGLSISEAIQFYKLDPAEDLMVIVDDIALPVGKIRVRAQGSAGGHNGLKDIQRVLTHDGYPRLRIGIGSPGRAPQKDYVLGRFNEHQQQELDPALDAACNAIETWLTKGLEIAMTHHNA